MTTIPADFAPHTRSSAVTRPWEPIYANPCDGSFRLGLVIAEAHCNTRNMLHGGVIAALADNAMGLTFASVRKATLNATASVVTTALSLDYFGVGHLGQWLEIVPRLVASGKSSGVVDAIISVGGAPIARANATFRVLA